MGALPESAKSTPAVRSAARHCCHFVDRDIDGAMYGRRSTPRKVSAEQDAQPLDLLQGEPVDGRSCLLVALIRPLRVAVATCQQFREIDGGVMSMLAEARCRPYAVG